MGQRTVIEWAYHDGDVWFVCDEERARKVAKFLGTKVGFRSVTYTDWKDYNG